MAQALGLPPLIWAIRSETYTAQSREVPEGNGTDLRQPASEPAEVPVGIAPLLVRQRPTLHSHRATLPVQAHEVRWIVLEGPYGQEWIAITSSAAIGTKLLDVDCLDHCL